MFFFFFNDTATTEIYTLSLHDALPISWFDHGSLVASLIGISIPIFFLGLLLKWAFAVKLQWLPSFGREDRKSTRLNSSHSQISYAVFCLKKKKNKQKTSF